MSQYYCSLCNSWIFGGNGLREHNGSQKHKRALEAVRAGGFVQFGDLIR